MFGRTTQYVVKDSTFVVAYNETFDVRELAENGALRLIVRLTGQERTLSDRAISTVVDSIETSSHAAGIDRDVVRREVSMYRSIPAHGPILGDDAGNIWVREYAQPGGDRARWLVFAPDGTLRAIADLPEGKKVLAVDEASVVVLSSTADGAEAVAVYPLLKSGGPRT